MTRRACQPIRRFAGSDRGRDGTAPGAALTSTLDGFETEGRTREETLVGADGVDWDMLAQAESLDRADEGDELLVPAGHSAPTPALPQPLYDALEARGVDYVIRIPANGSLEWEIAELLVWALGRPSPKPLEQRAQRDVFKPGGAGGIGHDMPAGRRGRRDGTLDG